MIPTILAPYFFAAGAFGALAGHASLSRHKTNTAMRRALDPLAKLSWKEVGVITGASVLGVSLASACLSSAILVNGIAIATFLGVGVLVGNKLCSSGLLSGLINLLLRAWDWASYNITEFIKDPKQAMLNDLMGLGEIALNISSIYRHMDKNYLNALRENDKITLENIQNLPEDLHKLRELKRELRKNLELANAEIEEKGASDLPEDEKLNLEKSREALSQIDLFIKGIEPIEEALELFSEAITAWSTFLKSDIDIPFSALVGGKLRDIENGASKSLSVKAFDELKAIFRGEGDQNSFTDNDLKALDKIRNDQTMITALQRHEFAEAHMPVHLQLQTIAKNAFEIVEEKMRAFEGLESGSTLSSFKEMVEQLTLSDKDKEKKIGLEKLCGDFKTYLIDNPLPLFDQWGIYFKGHLSTIVAEGLIIPSRFPSLVICGIAISCEKLAERMNNLESEIEALEVSVKNNLIKQGVSAEIENLLDLENQITKMVKKAKALKETKEEIDAELLKLSQTSLPEDQNAQEGIKAETKALIADLSEKNQKLQEKIERVSVESAAIDEVINWNQVITATYSDLLLLAQEKYELPLLQQIWGKYDELKKNRAGNNDLIEDAYKKLGQDVPKEIEKELAEKASLKKLHSQLETLVKISSCKTVEVLKQNELCQDETVKLLQKQLKKIPTLQKEYFQEIRTLNLKEEGSHQRVHEQFKNKFIDLRKEIETTKKTIHDSYENLTTLFPEYYKTRNAFITGTLAVLNKLKLDQIAVKTYQDLKSKVEETQETFNNFEKHKEGILGKDNYLMQFSSEYAEDLYKNRGEQIKTMELELEILQKTIGNLTTTLNAEKSKEPEATKKSTEVIDKINSENLRIYLTDALTTKTSRGNQKISDDLESKIQTLESKSKRIQNKLEQIRSLDDFIIETMNRFKDRAKDVETLTGCQELFSEYDYYNNELDNKIDNPQLTEKQFELLDDNLKKVYLAQDRAEGALEASLKIIGFCKDNQEIYDNFMKILRETSELVEEVLLGGDERIDKRQLETAGVDKRLKELTQARKKAFEKFKGFKKLSDKEVNWLKKRKYLLGIVAKTISGNLLNTKQKRAVAGGVLGGMRAGAVTATVCLGLKCQFGLISATGAIFTAPLIVGGVVGVLAAGAIYKSDPISNDLANALPRAALSRVKLQDLSKAEQAKVKDLVKKLGFKNRFINFVQLPMPGESNLLPGNSYSSLANGQIITVDLHEEEEKSKSWARWGVERVIYGENKSDKKSLFNGLPTFAYLEPGDFVEIKQGVREGQGAKSKSELGKDRLQYGHYDIACDLADLNQANKALSREIQHQENQARVGLDRNSHYLQLKLVKDGEVTIVRVYLPNDAQKDLVIVGNHFSQWNKENKRFDSAKGRVRPFRLKPLSEKDMSSLNLENYDEVFVQDSRENKNPIWRPMI